MPGHIPAVFAPFGLLAANIAANPTVVQVGDTRYVTFAWRIMAHAGQFAKQSGTSISEATSNVDVTNSGGNFYEAKMGVGSPAIYFASIAFSPTANAQIWPRALDEFIGGERGHILSGYVLSSTTLGRSQGIDTIIRATNTFLERFTRSLTPGSTALDSLLLCLLRPRAFDRNGPDGWRSRRHFVAGALAFRNPCDVGHLARERTGEVACKWPARLATSGSSDDHAIGLFTKKAATSRIVSLKKELRRPFGLVQ
ncbi:hypothetical protein BJV77DRAFT_965976 [Russula vinacea]|nr:hypothetical protein BJV77DRAFT_965976 [Russula vinacea]